MMDESNLNLEKSRMVDSEGNKEPESFFKKNKSYLEAFKEEMNYGEKYENSETSQILQSIIDEQEEKEKEKEKAFNDFNFNFKSVQYVQYNKYIKNNTSPLINLSPIKYK